MDQSEQPSSNTADTLLYSEPLRPQFHFTARQWTVHKLNPHAREEGWINDLNGLIYYDHEYHLFAQRWNRCWLHAVSKDLVHWTELEPAFFEESLNSGCQSGTCVVDYHNTSGLATDQAHPAMIAFWSRQDNRSQCISYSLDHGRTWTHYAHNPIIERPERDPKVFWHEPTHKWVMILYGEGSYHILTSSNLLEWHDENKPIPNSFECPDFFQLPLDGDHAHMKWVLIQGSGFYSVGEFDGTSYHEETERFPCDIGPNFYATQSWANTETGDGRRIQAAWMRGADFPDMPFSQEISFPCELKLRTTPKGPRLFREPIREISSLHSAKQAWSHKVLPPGDSLTLRSSGDLFQIKGEVNIPPGAKLTLDVRGVPVVLTRNSVDNGAKADVQSGRIETFEVLVDRGSIEMFLNHGEVSSTRFVIPTGTGLTLKAEGGPVSIRSLTVYDLKSIWPSDRTARQ